MTSKLGFVGAGNMAGAIIGGILRAGRLSPGDIALCDVSREALSRYQEGGHPVYSSPAELAAACGTVVLSVKPQVFPQVLPEVGKGMSPDKVLVSIAAGITAATIKKGVGSDCKLVLAMPNTPLLVGCGATALSRVEPATPEEFREVKELFACAGLAEEIPPDKMNEIIAVNGSSPAFLYLIAKTVAEKAGEEGIPPDTALRLFSRTMEGAAKMLAESGKSPQELIDMVCSPGGTTLAGLAALREQGLEEALRAGYDACTRRAEELSRG